ncbi:MAG: hypothetical protein WBB94_03370 [Candidatus Saccharimonadaceae bacterium]
MIEQTQITNANGDGSIVQTNKAMRIIGNILIVLSVALLVFGAILYSPCTTSEVECTASEYSTGGIVFYIIIPIMLVMLITGVALRVNSRKRYYLSATQQQEQQQPKV